MVNPLTRREFLVRSSAATGLIGAAGAALRPAVAATQTRAEREAAARNSVDRRASVRTVEAETGIRKALYWGMLPGGLSVDDRFKLTRDVGFAGVEVPTLRDAGTVDQFRQAAEKAGIRIHSVMNSDHWKFPLSSGDPQIVEKGIACIRKSLENAAALGADTVLLVPAVVNPQTRYADAYSRSMNEIRKLVPSAEELGVAIAIENVWNKFLLSPLEFADYIDRFKSRAVRAYFDVGNIVAYGFPQDWIRTLGGRIAKVHVKDFDARAHDWRPLLEGSIDWKEVRAALAEIKYDGWMTAELPAGDEKYLKEVSERMTRIIDGRT